MSNNKQSMKLYTEEQVTELTTAAFTAGQNHNPAIFGVAFEKLTPIELPSDEEIEQEANTQYPVNLQPNGRTLAGSKYDVDINYSERNAFKRGAKMVINKIQGGNNEY